MKVEIRKEVIDKLNKMIEECKVMNARVEAHRVERDSVFTSKPVDLNNAESVHAKYIESLNSLQSLADKFFIVKDGEIQRLNTIFNNKCSEFEANLKRIDPKKLMESFNEFEKEQKEIQRIIKELQTYKLPIK